MVAKMVSNRSFTIIFFTLISAIVLLITAKRLDQSTWDPTSYTAGQFRQKVFKPQPTPDLDTESRLNATIQELLEKLAAVTPTVDDVKPTPTPEPERDPICDGFPDTSNILLVMKTGATESFNRIPVQLMTVLKCLPDFLLFSDLEQHIGGHLVRDSLQTVLSEAMEDNGDFDLYRKQKTCAIDQDNCIKTISGADSAGWNLDKYKNIHMAEKTYRLRPNYDWYIFVDADTYVSWPNMVHALSRLDPSKQRYLGSVTLIGSRTFAHGGSGYVLSRGAMEEFVGKNPGIANKYDSDIRNTCCGDFMFAVALHDTIGLLVEGFWPLSNGEKPFTMPLGPGAWCQPVGMLHHMNSEEVSIFWDFERRWYRENTTPLIFREVFRQLIEPRLRTNREDWDSFCDDYYYIDFDSPDHEWEEWRVGRSVKEEDKTEIGKKAHQSWQDCQAACDENTDCFQFMWHNECCAMQRSIRLGKPMPRGETEKERFMSGWNLNKIKQWTEEYERCDVIQWPGILDAEVEAQRNQQQSSEAGNKDEPAESGKEQEMDEEEQKSTQDKEDKKDDRQDDEAGKSEE